MPTFVAVFWLAMIVAASADCRSGPPPVALADQVGVAIITEDGRSLVAGNNAGEVMRWDLAAADPAQARSQVGSKADWPVRMLGASGDGRWIVAVYYSGVARLWDSQRPDAPIDLRDEGGAIRATTFTPDGRRLVTGGDNGARLWDLGSSAVAASSIPLRGAEGGGRVGHLEVTRDGRWLATGATSGPASLWDLQTSPPAEKRLPPRDGERSVWPDGVSADGRWLVTGSEGGAVGLWDLRAGAETPVVLRGHQHSVLNTEFSPNSRWLATASSLSDENVDPAVRLWNLGASDVAGSGRPFAGHTGRIRRMQISRDSHWLVTTSDDRTARRWDLTASDPARSSVAYQGHRDRVMAVAITPDSDRAATASLDGTVHVWNLRAAVPEATVLEGGRGGVDFIKIGGDGRWLMAQTTSNALLLWDLRAVP